MTTSCDWVAKGCCLTVVTGLQKKTNKKSLKIFVGAGARGGQAESGRTAVYPLPL